jgi:hypothetical protein
VVVKQYYQVNISSKFAALENSDDDDDDDRDDADISRTWESIRKNMIASTMDSLGYYKLKRHKSWFDVKCSKLLDQREQAKLQWLQNPSQTKGNNINNARRETSRTSRNKPGNV